MHGQICMMKTKHKKKWIWMAIIDSKPFWGHLICAGQDEALRKSNSNAE